MGCADPRTNNLNLKAPLAHEAQKLREGLCVSRLSDAHHRVVGL